MPVSEGKRFYAREIAWELYRRGQSSKTDLVAQLGISLPTVLQNVRLLRERGLVEQSGQFESRGGRKADILVLNRGAHFAIGLDITKNHISLVAVDLGGAVRHHVRLGLPFAPKEAYYQGLKRHLAAFLEKNGIPPSKVLGVGVSLPGILSQDGGTLNYSHALNLRDESLAGLTQSLAFPVLAVNDANAAALAEKRLMPSENLVYLSLSNSVGGAIFVNGNLYMGDNRRSAEFGHISVVPDGRECYCGKLGCFDAYCSALRLSTPFGGKLAGFFEALARGDQQARGLWMEYRRYLTIMCNHLRTAFDCQVMLGGYVGAFLEPYLEEIAWEASRLNTFQSSGHYICCCHYQTEAAATGAALLPLERFLAAL